MLKKLSILGFVGLLAMSCEQNTQQRKNNGGDIMELKVTSSAFEQGGMIPAKYTCDGKNISPPLKWESLPEQTKSLAVIMDDPDAPMGTFVHWVMFNIPADTSGLDENVPGDSQLPNGSLQGMSSFGKTGYGGPCPPSGTHRYFFKLYALDKDVELDSSADKTQLLEAIQGHILARGELIGRYQRR